MAGQRLGVGGLHGVGNAGEGNPLLFWIPVDTDADPTGCAAGKDGLGQAIGAGSAEQGRIGAVLSGGYLLALSPERIAALGSRVDAEYGFNGVTWPVGQFTCIAHLLRDNQGGGPMRSLFGLRRTLCEGGNGSTKDEEDENERGRQP